MHEHVLTPSTRASLLSHINWPPLNCQTHTQMINFSKTHQQSPQRNYFKPLQRIPKLAHLKQNFLHSPLVVLSRPKHIALQAGHRYPNIGLRQSCYKQHIDKLKLMDRAPVLSPYHKRKRACVEYMSKHKEAATGGAHKVGGLSGQMLNKLEREMVPSHIAASPEVVEYQSKHPMPQSQACGTLWALIRELDEITDFKHDTLTLEGVLEVQGRKRRCNGRIKQC